MSLDPSSGPLVVVSVGTDHHRFDRLVAWMDDWAAGHPEARVVIQRGSAERTRHAQSDELIPYARLCSLFSSAAAVVAHGGPATVMEARAAGRVPLVVPRDPERGEHVDGHQIRFSRHLDRAGLARVRFETDELAPLLDQALADADSFLIPTGGPVAAGVAEFGRVVDDLLGLATPVGLPRDERVIR